MTEKGATFVDLDGTLLSGNSMKIFMKCLPGMLLKQHAFGGVLASLWWMGLRSCRLIAHKNLKWRLTRLSRRHLDESDWDKVAERIALHLNPHVVEYMDAASRSKCEKYIASAALEEYVLPLSRMLGYDGAVATRFCEDKEDYIEMRGTEKRDGIELLLKNKRLRLESFLTDHYDDLPTARLYPGLTVLVNPTRKMQDLFHKVGVTRYLI